MPAKSYGNSLGLLVVRIALGAIFLLAGLSKVQDPSGFADAVRAFHLLPSLLVVPFALVLPWLEVLVAAYLVVGFLTRVGAIGAAAMLLMFIIALADALVTGNTAHACGCFSGLASSPIIALLAGGNSIGWWDLIRDLILLALSLLLIWRGAGVLSTDNLLTRTGRGLGAYGTAEEV